MFRDSVLEYNFVFRQCWINVMLNDGQGELLVGYTGQVGRVIMGPYLCYKCSQRNVVVSFFCCCFIYLLTHSTRMDLSTLIIL